MNTNQIDHMFKQIIHGEILPDLPNQYMQAIVAQLAMVIMADKNGHLECYREAFNGMCYQFMIDHGCTHEEIIRLFGQNMSKYEMRDGEGGDDTAPWDDIGE